MVKVHGRREKSALVTVLGWQKKKGCSSWAKAWGCLRLDLLCDVQVLQPYTYSCKSTFIIDNPEGKITFLWQVWNYLALNLFLPIEAIVSIIPYFIRQDVLGIPPPHPDRTYSTWLVSVRLSVSLTECSEMRSAQFLGPWRLAQSLAWSRCPAAVCWVLPLPHPPPFPRTQP